MVKDTKALESKTPDAKESPVIVYGRKEIGTLAFQVQRTVHAIPVGHNEKVPMPDDTVRIALPFSLKKPPDESEIKKGMTVEYPYTALLDETIAGNIGLTVDEVRKVVENHPEFKAGNITILYEGNDRAEATKIAWINRPVPKASLVTHGRGSGDV